MNEKITNLVYSIKNEQQIIVASKSIIKEKIDELKRHVYKTIKTLWDKHFGKKSDIHYEDSLLLLEETLDRDLEIGCYEIDWPYELYIYPQFSDHNKYCGKELSIYNNQWYQECSMDDFEEKMKEIGEQNFWDNHHDQFKEVKLDVTVKQFNKFLKELEKETGLKFQYFPTIECSLGKLDGEIIE